MIKVYLLLVTVIALLLHGIYKQSEVKELESALATLKAENSQYKKDITKTAEKLIALKGQLGYLDVEATSLHSDIEFMKANPCVWSISETENYLKQLKTGIAEASLEGE